MAMHGSVQLQTLLAQENPDRLAEAALWLARDLDPSVNISVYLQRLQYYADAISERLTPYAQLGDVLFQLNNYLYNDRAFTSDGTTPYRPDFNLLHQVIDKRCGPPLSLAVIYLTVGRWLGLPLVGVSFPGRILLKYADEDGEVVLDPAEGGMPMQETDLEMLLARTYAPGRVPLQQLKHFLSTSDDKALLVRMLRQLKQAYLLRGDVPHALWALENILQLVPEQPTGFRERGHLYELLDCSFAAAEDYNRYLEMLPDASDADRLRKRLPKLLQSRITLH